VTEHLGDEIEQALRAVGWTTHGADPAVVTSAVRQLRLVRSEQEGWDAYNAVLDAIGHNHSGWLYDAAGPAAAILVAVTHATQGWARRTALEILIDCLAWVRPEQRFIDIDGRTRSVKAGPPRRRYKPGARTPHNRGRLGHHRARRQVRQGPAGSPPRARCVVRDDSGPPASHRLPSTIGSYLRARCRQIRRCCLADESEAALIAA